MYALVDCNSFYASCQQIFRPDLRDKPIVILSNNDGCIVARSKEAKALNIPDLQAYFKIKEVLAAQKVQVFSSNYALYGDISKRIMETLKTFSPEVEVYSIDEMFIGLNGFTNDLNAYGHEMKTTIWQHIRMPVSVGIAPTKTLAKLANHAAKKIPQCEGVCVLDQTEKWEWLLRRLPTQKVWGIGKRIAKRLADNNINTAYDLAKSDTKRLRKLYSVCLERTANELNGIPCLDLETIADKKQIYVTRSFGTKVFSLPALHEAIAMYATRACEKLRKQQHLVKTLHVFLQTSPFLPQYYVNSLVVQLPYPTDDPRLVIHCAKIGMTKIYRERKAFLKCGIGLIELMDKHHQQGDFFSQGQPQQADKLVNTLDKINSKYGSSTVFFAAQGIRKPWTMRREFLSPSYTTQWQDIPTIKL